MGEHAVVYGWPALAMPVAGVAATATVWASEASPSVVALDLGRVTPIDAPGDDVAAIAVRGALRAAGHLKAPPWRVEVSSTIPVGRGMGSSAAVAVAAARGTLTALDAAADHSQVVAVALGAERAAHGRPSGIDPAVVAEGRPMRFQAGTAAPLAVGGEFRFLVGDSGCPGDTGAMVTMVRTARTAARHTYDDWFAAIGSLVGEAEAALATGDQKDLGRLMNANHALLGRMGLATEALEGLVARARAAGAMGAKLTGAGGGGAMIALVTAEGEADVARALREAGAAGVYSTVLTAGPRQGPGGQRRRPLGSQGVGRHPSPAETQQ